MGAYFFPFIVAHFRRSFLYEADALISFRVCEGSSRSLVTHKCITQMAYYSNLRIQRDNYRHESHISNIHLNDVSLAGR